ncbi:TPA: HAD family phosphatase [bacterium]|nr:HAD family phosphatase [bacterium]
MIKGAIFDLDGTIIDSMGLWMEEGNKLLKEYNVPDYEEICRTWVPKSMYETCVYVSEKFGLNKDELVRIWESKMEYHYLNTVTLKGNILNTFNYLKSKDVILMVATATKRELTDKVLERLGIKDYFTHIYTTQMVNKSKDYPDVYLACSKSANLGVNECFVFEDAYHGIRTAKNAGFNVIGVYEPTMNPYVDIVKKYSDYVIKDYDEVKELPIFN